MTPEERPFTPDEIDARIDHSSSVDAPPSSDQRLMRSLHALYSAEEQEMTNALERGRERLSEHLASLPTPQQRDGPAGNVVSMFTEGRSAGPSLQEGSLRARRWPLRLASLAAAVLLVVLVGSLVAGLVLVRHNTAGTISKPGVTTQPSATTTSAPAQTNLYLVSGMMDSSIVKVDTTTRQIAWTYTWNTSQDGSAGFGPLLAGDGAVYFNAGSAPAGSDSVQMSLYALDAAQGTLRWQNKTLGNGAAALLAANGMVYVSAGTDLYAFNAHDSSTRWRTQVGDNVSRLALAQGVLYGATFDIVNGQWSSSLFAVNAADGTLLWGSPLPANKSFTVAAVVDGTMYLSSVEEKYPTGGEESVHSDGKPKISYVYAYSLTGKQLWQSQQFEGFLSGLSIGDGAIYFAGTDAYALSTRDGSLLWDYPIDAGIIQYNGLAFANGTVYLESVPNGSDDPADSYLIALDGQSAHVQWKHKLDSTIHGMVGTFALANGFLYVAVPGFSTGAVEAFNTSDGSLAWQTSVKGDLQSSLIAAP
jgi:outer membrane protein assembly factor BamB